MAAVTGPETRKYRREMYARLLAQLDRYECQCGSGGSMACDEDCPGDTRAASVVEALKVLIEAVQRLELG